VQSPSKFVESKVQAEHWGSTEEQGKHLFMFESKKEVELQVHWAPESTKLAGQDDTQSLVSTFSFPEEQELHIPLIPL